MVPEPRPLDDLDRLLGADPGGDADGALACFEPQLPSHAADAAFDALVARYRERWAEYWGEVGDRLRVLEAGGVVTVDAARGVVCDPSTGTPLRTLPPAR